MATRGEPWNSSFLLIAERTQMPHPHTDATEYCNLEQNDVTMITKTAKITICLVCLYIGRASASGDLVLHSDTMRLSVDRISGNIYSLELRTDESAFPNVIPIIQNGSLLSPSGLRPDMIRSQSIVRNGEGRETIVSEFDFDESTSLIREASIAGAPFTMPQAELPEAGGADPVAARLSFNSVSSDTSGIC